MLKQYRFPFPELIFFLYMILHGQSDEYIWDWVIWSEGHDHFWRQIPNTIWKSIYDFLFNFNGNRGPICKRFQVTALWNMLDLDFDLSRSPQVKANGAIWKSIYDFLFNFNGNHAPICKHFQVTLKYAWNMLDLDLTTQGHSRSKPMAPFERSCITSYSTLIVTMRLSVTVWKIQPFENMWPNGHIGHR